VGDEPIEDTMDPGARASAGQSLDLAHAERPVRGGEHLEDGGIEAGDEGADRRGGIHAPSVP
jgi:hypothetical protein